MLFGKKISLSVILTSCLIHTLDGFNNNTIIVDPEGKISQGEKNYIDKRSQVTKAALEKLAQKKLSEYPKIGLCLSGGGYRSMICSLGFILALVTQEDNLWDAATYTASLSGSTWNIGSILIRKIFLNKLLEKQKMVLEQKKAPGFFANTWGYCTALTNYIPSIPYLSCRDTEPVEKEYQDETDNTFENDTTIPAQSTSTLLEKEPDFFQEFKQKIQASVAHSFWDPLTLHWNKIVRHLEKKHETYGHIEPADLWGALITDRLLGDLPEEAQNLSLAKIREFLEKTDTEPYPLFSCVMKQCPKITQEYGWFEVDPYTSGSHDLHGFIPTEYLGSLFEGGKLVKKLDEEDLCFLLGIFGSPYDFNIGDPLLLLAQAIPKKYKCREKIIKYVKEFISKHDLCKKNFLPSHMNNPTYKMKSSPFAQKFLELSDAGFDYNVTTPPLLRRKTDVIICCDASTDACTKDFPELQKAKKYAEKHKLPFPSLKYYKKIDKYVHLFKWDDQKKMGKNIPTIIYFSNPISEPTLKFHYPKKEFTLLCETMCNIVKKNKSTVIQEILAKCE